MNDSLVDLRDLPQEALIHFVKSLGQPAFRGRQLLPWLYRPSRIDFADMTDLAREFRAVLATRARVSRSS